MDDRAARLGMGAADLVALAEDPRGGEWLPLIARTLHDSMYPSQLARK
ncbi:MAG: hypothetical protein KC464_02435 [Myxococcales bacterium]|nr:hypothetical protein [Myxococcales bacterium]